MTSLVKPAMPPALVQKAGLESKMARSRAPQVDFAEALGIAKQDSSKKSAAMNAEGGNPVTAWPRLATKLGSAFEPVHHPALKPEAPGDSADEEPGNKPADGDLPNPQVAAERLLERDATQQDQIHAPAVGAPLASPARQDPSPPKRPQPFVAQDNRTPRVEADVEAPSSLARSTGKDALASSTPISTETTSETPRAVSFAPLLAGDRAEPQQPPSATRTHPTASVFEEDRASAAGSLPEAAEQVRASPRATVVSQQNVPAPMVSTALVLVDSIAGSELLGASNTAPPQNAIHASATHASAQSLKIQLHPAELGMVTATLRFAGERLSIELRVEGHEAYRRLTSDSDTIVGSLRDLGYDIEKVTVLQPPGATSSSARADSPAAMPANAGRSGDEFNSAMSNGGSAGSGERSAGNGGKQGQGEQNRPPSRIEKPESGLYI